MGANTEKALSQAVDRFITEVIGAYEQNENGVFCVQDAIAFSHAGTYAVNTLTVDGVSIAEYVIVYPYASLCFEGDHARQLAERIEEISGYRIPVYDDSQKRDGSYELHIGLTSEDSAYATTLSLEPDAYVIEAVDKKVILASNTIYGYAAASNALQDMISQNAIINQSISLDFSEKVTGLGSNLSIKVMSYNIYYGRLNETRMSHVLEMIQKHNPDILGVQEATPEWKAYLTEHLGDVYEIIGESRNGNGDGEANLVLYRKDKFEVNDKGTLWLSYMPEYPSKFNESSLNRVVTYVIMTNKTDGKQFAYFNTHLDHTSEVAREKQVGVLMNIAEKYKDLPRIITGDLNAKPDTSPIQMLLQRGYADSANAALDSIPENTFGDEKIIDYCFISPERVKALTYRVDTFKYNAQQKDPSDHAPVIVELLII